MTGRHQAKPAPLIRSSTVLRAIATAATLTSLAGMTAFASTHLQNAAAPLKPAAPAAAVPAPTPAPTARTSTRERDRRTTVVPGVPSTNAAPRTRTRSS